MTMWTRLSLVAASWGFATALRSSKLQPDGHHVTAEHGRPIRFSFAPEAEEHGVDMHSFSLQVWSTGGEPSLVARKDVQSAEPFTEMLLAPGRYQWDVQWKSTDGEVADIAKSEVVVAPHDDVWDGVPWLGHEGSNEFSLNTSVSGKVELMVATLGFGYVTVNGKEISSDLLSYSGWTSTPQTVLYRTYDVSELIGNDGAMNVQVGLGCGYRCDSPGQSRFPAYKDHEDLSTDTIARIFRLQVLADDKRVLHSGSDGWLCRQGPVTEDSVYDGETFNPSAVTAWAPAPALPSGWGPKGKMAPALFQGVRVTRTDEPISITKVADDVHVVDFGSNVAGVCSISVPELPDGSATVTLKHGELMQHEHLPDVKSPDKSRVYFGNLRSAKAADTLVLTSPIKDWMPRFTYHGFRYVEVSGYPGELTKDSIKRLRMHTAVPDKAKATFDDEVLQAIHDGAVGAQRSNLMQVPTDCPQRDERLGWMGDMSLSAESMLLHFDMPLMASAFVDSMVDEMGSDGSFPDVVPFQRFGNRPADLSWSAAFLSVLTSLWQEAGLLDAAKTHWDSVKTHIGNLQAQLSKAGGITTLPEPYGDWCPPPVTPGKGDKETPSKGFAAAFSMVRAIQQAADLGEALGGEFADDAKTYSSLAADLRNQFHTGFYDSDKKQYDNGAMITSVLPLALGVVPESEKDAVVQNLLSHITSKNGTWSGGIINNRFMFDVLHDNGHGDVALAMLKRRDYPSYGYMYFNEFEPARECMWELPDAPFQGTGMNSRNHHMYSSVGSYLVRRIAGLSRGSGSGEVTAVVGSEPQSSASLHTPRGDVEFGWRRKASGLEVDVMVPVGMRAQLHVPVADGPLRGGSLTTAEFTATELHGKQYVSLTLSSGRHSLTSAASMFV